LYYENEGTFIESSGLYGESKIQRLALQGNVLKPLVSTELASKYFGEGVTLNPADPEEYLMLTW